MSIAAAKVRKGLPAELHPASLTAVIDSREQLAYDTAPFDSIIGNLQAGDYSLRGFEHLLAVERKTLADFVSCCGAERPRFERELQRLLAYPHRLVVIECSWDQLVSEGPWLSTFMAWGAPGFVLTWMGFGIPFLFAGNREAGECATMRFMLSVAQHRYQELRSIVAGMEAAQ